MKFGIATKLFLVMVAISVVVILAMSVTSRIGFIRGFVGYLNDQGRARMESLIPRLEEAYREHGNWEFLRGNSRAWSALLWPNPDDPLLKKTGPIPTDVDFTGFYLRTALLDTDRKLVTGNTNIDPDAPMRAITVDGQVVGWLGLVPFQKATSAADVRFQRRQLTATWIIGLSAVVLAALAAWALSRLLVMPLKRITGATQRLAAGDYSARIVVDSRDEIGRLSKDFNHLAQALANNERLRRSFMADVSHELRTPLAVLRGELEAVEDGVRQLSSTTLASLQSEVATLTKLVSDLYDLSLADVGALSYRMIDLHVGDVLQTTLAAFEHRFAERNLTVKANIDIPGPMVCADQARLQQLLNNLFENSARYTDRGGELRIRCGFSEEDILLELEDSGPGVPAEVLPHLFERFVRAESSRSRASGGAGLGLAICHSIVQAHGGTIDATAAPLGGLLIQILLPRRPG